MANIAKDVHTYVNELIAEQLGSLDEGNVNIEPKRIFAIKEPRRYCTMEKKTFSIPNITCGHCVMAIKNELSELEGIKTVEGDPTGKTITVEWEAPVTVKSIEDKLKEINYPAA